MGGGLPEREVVEVLILAIHFLTNFFHEILYDLLIKSIDDVLWMFSYVFYLCLEIQISDPDSFLFLSSSLIGFPILL